MRLLYYLRDLQNNGYVSWPSELCRPVSAALVKRGRINPLIGPSHALCLDVPFHLVSLDSKRAGAGFFIHPLALFGLLLLTFLLLFLIFPAPALAWGPGVHMITGNWVLQNLAFLPPEAAQALMRYPGQYLHGSLAADIFIGKGSKAKAGHSHNWESGLALLDKASNQRRLSYALGYLSHLAADTVAHNVYVPGFFPTAPGSGRLAHVFIEMHADANLKWDSLDARGVFHEAGSSASERILRETIRQKAWKYWLKKHLYEGSIGLGGSHALRRSMRVLSRIFPGDSRLALLEYMLTLSTRGIVSMLRDQDSSPVLRLDPVGADALALAGARLGPRRGPRKIVTGSIKSIMRRVRPALPNIELVAPVPQKPEINIVVPEIMLDLPEVCTPTSFTRRDEEQE